MTSSHPVSRLRTVLSLAFLCSLAAPAGAQCEVAEVLPIGPIIPSTSGSEFGAAIALHGDLALVGAPHQAPAPPGIGVAYVFEKQPVLGWVGVAALTQSDIAPGHELGASVALFGDVAVVGNPGDDDLGPGSGSAIVFERLGGMWFETAKLLASDGVGGGRFGAALDLEGGRLVVGSPGASATTGGGTGVPSAGAAYVFERVGPGAWVEIAKLADPASTSGSAMGADVAISGQSILVGAPGKGAAFVNAGSAFVFQEFLPGAYTLTNELFASDATASDAFGAAVDLDGDVAVIGAPNDSDVCMGCGSAYVFRLLGPGAAIEELKIGENSVIDGELLGNDQLGAAVAVSGDLVAVAAPANLDGGLDSGSVFLYRAGLSGWVKTNKLNACDTAGLDLFGAALAIDQGTVAIGAPGVDDAGPEAGSAYFFSSEGIELAGADVGFLFEPPESLAAIAGAMPVGGADPSCTDEPLFPRIEITDLGPGAGFTGHRFVHRGRLWDMYLVEDPIPTSFAFDGYDVTQADEVFHAAQDDCDPNVEFDVEYGYVDPPTGATGTLATFLWTDCNATNGGSELGPFEVELEVFVPASGVLARFDLSAENSGPPSPDWAFWAGRVNLSVVEDHPDPPDELTYELLTPFGQLVTDPALNLIGDTGLGIPTRADALGRPSNQVLGFYDDKGRGLYAAMSDASGDRAKNFQFFGCPGGAGTPATLNLSALTYQDDVSADAAFVALPSTIGRFRGDWYDLASMYRVWMADHAEFTANGFLKDRTDVPEFIRRVQMAAVLSPLAAQLDSIVEPGAGARVTPHGTVKGGPLKLPTGSRGEVIELPERLEEYMDHWGLDRMTTALFGTEWAGGCSGIGDYEIEKLYRALALRMQAKEDEMAASGKELKYLAYMLDVAYATTGVLLDWDSTVIRRPNGDAFTWTPAECGATSVAMIDPATPEWQDHVYDVARELGELGVDGIYCDNAFPELTQYDFSTTHGHAPGFGPYLTEGFGDAFHAIQDGGAFGNPSADPDFVTYTEFFVEGYISRSDTYGPEQVFTDWMTASDATRHVPLISTLYHHYTVLGPAFVGYYTHDKAPYDYPNNVLNLFDAGERAKGRIGANFTMAWGWAGGCPIWSPDPGLASPLTKKLSYELDEADYALPAGTFDDLRSVCAFGAELARVRGYPLAMPFLLTGRRLRDLELTTTPASVPVVLMEIANPYDPSVTLGPETEDFPPIVHGVWRDLDTDEVGIALANFTASSATADFTIDPVKLGFGGAVSAFVVGPTGETLHTGPFTTETSFSLTLGGETTLFLHVRP